MKLNSRVVDFPALDEATKSFSKLGWLLTADEVAYPNFTKVVNDCRITFVYQSSKKPAGYYFHFLLHSSCDKLEHSYGRIFDTEYATLPLRQSSLKYEAVEFNEELCRQISSDVGDWHLQKTAEASKRDYLLQTPRFLYQWKRYLAIQAQLGNITGVKEVIENQSLKAKISSKSAEKALAIANCG